MTGPDGDSWRCVVSVEQPGRFPDYVAYEQCRAFRLYAQMPPR
jgi:hypothetical protein